MNVYYCEELPRGISQHQLAYLLLEYLIKTEYPGTLGRFCYEKKEGGKPWIPDVPWLEFNVSHCSFCVAAACGLQPVGLDVERRFSWKDSLAGHICHPREQEFLKELAGIDREEWLQRIWSRKESCLKCTGVGLRKDLRQILVLDQGERKHSENFQAAGSLPETGGRIAGGRGGEETEKSRRERKKPEMDGSQRDRTETEHGRLPWKRIEPEPGESFWIQEVQMPEYTMAVCMKKKEPVTWRKMKAETLIRERN